MASYSKHRNFPPALQRDIRRYFRYFFSGKTALPEQEILGNMSASLRIEVSAFER